MNVAREWKRHVDAVIAAPKGSAARAEAERRFRNLIHSFATGTKRMTEFRVDYMKRAANDDSVEDREQGE